MRISFTNDKTSFTSTPLHGVNVYNAKGRFLTSAVFSKLSPTDNKDIEALKYILENWKGNPLLLGMFRDNFREIPNSLNEFHAIELPGMKNLGEKIVGLTMSYPRKDFDNSKIFHLALIVVKPELRAEIKDRGIKNVGEVLLGEMFNLAKKMKASSLELFSQNHGFYVKTFKNACIDISEENEIFSPSDQKFSIDKTLFNKYIEYCKNKFSINFSNKKAKD